MKYHLITLGCQMNISDSERVKSVVEGMGFKWTDNEDEASLLGVLACSVRQKSINKAYSKISKWNKRKDRENLITFISGCVLPADKENFLKTFDLIFSMNELLLLPDMISQYGVVTPAGLRSRMVEELTDFSKNLEIVEASPQGINLTSVFAQNGKISSEDIRLAIDEDSPDIEEFWDIKPDYDSTFEAFVPIQNGCDKFCSYCAVPYTRGREVSRPSQEIFEEVISLVNKGYKSITLLGQNVNSYGLDKKGNEVNFAQLLDKIGQYGNKSEKEFWIYFTSPHPRDMGEDVIDAIAKYKCIANQIHLPLQSGDDKVLIRMNRKHHLDDYRKIVDYIRKKIPEATLFTDIIVGFTGESDEQFENSKKAMNEFKFNMAYIAIYSPRPGAASARWDDDIPLPVKKERLHKLTDELQIHSANYNKTLQDKTIRVLLTGMERRSGYLSGHTEGRIPVRIYSYDKNLVGSFVDVKIVSCGDFSVAGEIV